MDQEKITVRILVDGTVECEVNGVKGASCTALTDFLKQMGDVEKVKLTEEFYQDEMEEHVGITL